MAERFVERDQLDREIAARDRRALDRGLLDAAAALVRGQRPRVVDEDTPHHLRSEGVKLLAMIDVQRVLPTPSGLSRLNTYWMPERGARMARRNDRAYRELSRRGARSPQG